MNRTTGNGEWQLTGDDDSGYALTRHAAPGSPGQPGACVVPCADRGGWRKTAPRPCDGYAVFPAARSGLIAHAASPDAVAAIAVLLPA